MQLVLEASGDGPGVARKVFDGAGGVIGRGNGCDWVIPDGSRVLSGQHGVVSYRDGRYFLTDISSNGIGLAGSDERLRKGQPHLINDGNLFEFGPLAIRARLVESRPCQAEGGPIPDDAFLTHGLQPLIEPQLVPDSAWVERGAPESDHLVPPTLAKPVHDALVPQPIAPADDGLFWSHFAQALGMPLGSLDTPGREALAIKVASLLKHTLDDVQQCVRTCDELKRELRLGTAHSPGISHNPLHDCQGVEAALQALLGDGALGELSAQQSVAQVFRDLQAHQVAMLAACRAALRGAHQAFAPDYLQRRLERQAKRPRLLTDGARWRAYQCYYHQLLDAQAPGEGELGRDFSTAYQEQLRLIATLHAAYPG